MRVILAISFVACASVCAMVSWADALDQFSLQRAEYAKYHRQITGKDAPKGAVEFAIDPKVSKSGKDAYKLDAARADGDGSAELEGEEVK